MRAFVPNALCFRADCIFGFVYQVRVQIVLRSRQIEIRSRGIFWTMHFLDHAHALFLLCFSFTLNVYISRMNTQIIRFKSVISKRLTFDVAINYRNS